MGTVKLECKRQFAFDEFGMFNLQLDSGEYKGE